MSLDTRRTRHGECVYECRRRDRRTHDEVVGARSARRLARGSALARQASPVSALPEPSRRCDEERTEAERGWGQRGARLGRLRRVGCPREPTYLPARLEGGAAASQKLLTRRPSAHQALPGGEPGDPASVPGRKTPQGDTGTPLRDGCTFVLGCPTGETVDNQRRERRTSLSANAEAAAHGGALPTTRKADSSKKELVGILKKMQIGAGERRTVSAGHGFKTTATIEVAVNDDERNDAESES